MFFIGIFGINRDHKPIGTCNNAVCPACGAFTHFDVFMEYSYFHIFFIPAFRWNIKYYVKSACCGTVYELDPAIGQQYKRGLNPEIGNEHLRPINRYFPFKICSGCGARVEPGYSFCPYCGRRL